MGKSCHANICRLYVFPSPDARLILIRFLGIFTSFLIPETKRKRLEELTGMSRHRSRSNRQGRKESFQMLR